MASLRRRIKQPTQNPTPTLAAIRTSSHNAGRPTTTMAAASTLTIQVSNVKRPSMAPNRVNPFDLGRTFEFGLACQNVSQAGESSAA